MTDVLIGVALSNLLVSGVIALAAYGVHRRGRYPMLSHLLWVLVLVKLVTPPLLTLPVATLPAMGGLVSTAGLTGMASAAPSPSLVAILASSAISALLLAWAVGSAIVFFVSVWRIRRFDRLLRSTSTPAPAPIQALADSLVDQLGLRSAPTIYLSRARLSPLTWWTGGHVRIIIPSALPDEVDAERLRWVIAHELAHVKRRDYMVRWLEWLACVAFWWNPVVWWTRRYLRDDEEASCDALVVERLGVEPRSYARTLLAVVEFLSGDLDRPPAVATGIDGGGSLEKRLRLIVAGRRIKAAPRWLIASVVGSALVLMPLGVGSAGTTVDLDLAEPASPGTSGAVVAAPIDIGLTGPGPAAADSIDTPSSDPAEYSLLSGRIGDGSARNGLRVRTRRAVKRAVNAATEAGPGADASAKRSVRRLIAAAGKRLDKAVARNLIARKAANQLKQGLRGSIRTNQPTAAEMDLSGAITSRLISPENAARLLESLGGPAAAP